MRDMSDHFAALGTVTAHLFEIYHFDHDGETFMKLITWKEHNLHWHINIFSIFLLPYDRPQLI